MSFLSLKGEEICYEMVYNTCPRLNQSLEVVKFMQARTDFPGKNLAFKQLRE